jgi:hypothetical protein
MEGGACMASTCFADVPDDRNERDAAVLYDFPAPGGVAVHSSYYDDGEYAVHFTFISPIALVPYRQPLLSFTDLQ